MAAFLAAQKFRFNGQPESPASVVLRSDMDRGWAKQRRTQADVPVRQTLTLLFRTLTEVDNFNTWFFATISAGQDAFDFTLLRKVGGSPVVVQARIVNGELGALQHVGQRSNLYARDITIEWMQSL